MLTKAEIVGGNALQSAGSAVANILTSMALKTLLGDKGLSQHAQTAILAMESHFLAERDASLFSSPLLRTGIYPGKEPFKKAESISYLGAKVENNHRRLSILTNSNLKEAATHLWDLHCEIAMHMIHRLDATFERSDKDHSYVLMYLQESVAMAFEQIVNKADLTDDDISKLQNDLKSGIEKPFINYIQNTQSLQSSGARRTALSHQVRISIEKICHALERFVTEKPLRTSINALQHKAQSFNNTLKQMLLAIVLVPQKDAAKQQNELWVLQRKMMLSKTVEIEQHQMLSCLKTQEMNSLGYQGQSGVLYKNPLAARVLELIDPPLHTRDQLYFALILNIFNLSANSLEEQSEFNRITEQFKERLKLTPISHSFILNDILCFGITEAEFVENSLLLFRQTHELARFMAALQQFIQLVGKLGLYNNVTLHTQLTDLIQSSLTSLEKGLHQFKMHMKEGADARVGGWLSPIDELFQLLKSEGSHIIHEMRSFQTHFAKMIDPSAMQMEFQKSKQELLQAALGLGYASQISPLQMDEIQKKIGRIELTDFTGPPTEGVNVNERMRNILSLTSDMGTKLEEAKTEIDQLKMLNEVTIQELSRVQTLMCEHETIFRQGQDSLMKSKEQVEDNTRRAGIMLGEIDQVIESFGQNIIGQINDLDIETHKDVEEANQLISSSAITLVTSSSASLSEQMTYLSGIKSKLEERQRSYQKMVETVSIFQKEYIAKRGQMTLVLTNIQEATKDIERTVIQLMAKISALTDIICSLRITLEKKDKQLAEQKNRLEELEAQLSALKPSDTHVTVSPSTTTSPQNHSFCFDEKDLSSRYFGRSSLSFFGRADSGIKPQPVTALEKINKPIGYYRHDIHEERFVRNRARKIVKYAIWCELNMIVIQKIDELPRQVNTTEELILEAIGLLKTRNFSVHAFNDVYRFNDIVAKIDNAAIYAEFIKGSVTSDSLKDLEPVFSEYIQKNKESSAHTQVADLA